MIVYIFIEMVKDFLNVIVFINNGWVIWYVFIFFYIYKEFEYLYGIISMRFLC